MRALLQCFRCGVQLSVICSAWEYGSYCSEWCSSQPKSRQEVLAAGADTQSSDDAGMNAFRRGQLQLDAGDPQERQLVD